MTALHAQSPLVRTYASLAAHVTEPHVAVLTPGIDRTLQVNIDIF